MTENIDKAAYLTQQWLTEIQSLKQQMAELQRQRDQAWESSEKWCQLYNTEAEQRRAEAQLSKQAIAAVKAELQKIQEIGIETISDGATIADITLEISNISVEELQRKYIATTAEYNRLTQALKIEQEHHAQTRKSLTTALGDAIDSLAKARAMGQEATTVKENLDLGEKQEDL
jgi:hypothetical protein